MSSMSATYYDDNNQYFDEDEDANCIRCFGFSWCSKQRNSDQEKHLKHTVRDRLQRLVRFDHRKNSGAAQSNAVGRNTIGLIDNHNNWVYMDPGAASRFKNRNKRLSALLEEELIDPEFLQYRYSTLISDSDEEHTEEEEDEVYHSFDEDDGLSGGKSFMKLLLYEEEKKEEGENQDRRKSINLVSGSGQDERTTLDPVDQYLKQHGYGHYISPSVAHQKGKAKDRRNTNSTGVDAHDSLVSGTAKSYDDESFVIAPTGRRKLIEVQDGEEDEFLARPLISRPDTHTDKSTGLQSPLDMNASIAISDTSTFVEFMDFLENVKFDNISESGGSTDVTISSLNDNNLNGSSRDTTVSTYRKNDNEHGCFSLTANFFNGIKSILTGKGRSSNINKRDIRVVVNTSDSQDQGSDSDPFHLLKRNKVELEPIDLNDITMVE